jgi:hypothetical protein
VKEIGERGIQQISEKLGIEEIVEKMKMKKWWKLSNFSNSKSIKLNWLWSRMSHEYFESEEERKSYERTETEMEEEEIKKCLNHLSRAQNQTLSKNKSNYSSSVMLDKCKSNEKTYNGM